MPSPRKDTVEVDLDGRAVTVPKGGLYDRYRVDPGLDALARIRPRGRRRRRSGSVAPGERPDPAGPPERRARRFAHLAHEDRRRAALHAAPDPRAQRRHDAQHQRRHPPARRGPHVRRPAVAHAEADHPVRRHDRRPGRPPHAGAHLGPEPQQGAPAMVTDHASSPTGARTGPPSHRTVGGPVRNACGPEERGSGSRTDPAPLAASRSAGRPAGDPTSGRENSSSSLPVSLFPFDRLRCIHHSH